MSTTTDLLEAIRDAIAADSILLTWCQAQFGVNPVVHLGMDMKKPLSAEDYPLIAVLGVIQFRGDGDPEIVWRIGLGVAVENEAITETGITVTYPGLLQAAELIELTEDAVYRARLGMKRSSEAETETISDYPAFMSTSTIDVSMKRSNRNKLP